MNLAIFKKTGIKDKAKKGIRKIPLFFFKTSKIIVDITPTIINSILVKNILKVRKKHIYCMILLLQIKENTIAKINPFSSFVITRIESKSCPEASYPSFKSDRESIIQFNLS